MSEQAVNILLTLAGFAVTILAALMIFMLNALLASGRKRDEKLEQIEKRLTQTEFQVTPLWAKVQKQLSEDLHHPEAKHEEMDGLLEKLEGLTITKGETARLKELLIDRTTDESVPKSEQDSASVMAIVMDKVLDAAARDSKIELVSVPITTGKTDAPETGAPEGCGPRGAARCGGRPGAQKSR